MALLSTAQQYAALNTSSSLTCVMMLILLGSTPPVDYLTTFHLYPLLSGPFISLSLSLKGIFHTQYWKIIIHNPDMNQSLSWISKTWTVSLLQSIKQCVWLDLDISGWRYLWLINDYWYLLTVYHGAGLGWPLSCRKQPKLLLISPMLHAAAATTGHEPEPK